jgi:hypothetical protein
MPDNTQKQGRGCFFYGCLGMVLIFIGVVVGVYFGTRKAVKMAVAAFTTNAPAAIPKLEMAPADREAVLRALEQEAQSAFRASNSATLALDEKELNALLAQAPQTTAYATQFYLKPAGTQLQAQVSLPLDQFQLWKDFTRKLGGKDLEGRYFNGVALLDPEITNGAIRLIVRDLIVNGKSLPGDFTGRLKNFDLAASARTNANSQEFLGRVQDVAVRDGQLIIKLAPPPATAP